MIVEALIVRYEAERAAADRELEQTLDRRATARERLKAALGKS